MVETPAHWPVGKVATEHGNYYEFGDERFLSVTSATSAFGKESLVHWSSGLAARGAFDRLPELVASLRVPPCGNSYNRCYEKHGRDQRCERCACHRCRTCMQRWLAHRHFEERNRRADEGTEVHAVIDTWIMNGGGAFPTGHRRPELVPYLRSFARLVADYGLVPDCFEMGSATVINRAAGYAGTLDCGLNLTHATGPATPNLLSRLQDTDGRILVDLKTRGGTGLQLYRDQPLQLSAYQRGEVIRLPDGRETPLPRYPHCAILQIRPDGADLEPVVTTEDTHQAFLHALGLFRWQVEYGTAAISPRSFLPPAAPQPVKKTARKAVKKTTPRRPAAPARTSQTAAEATRALLLPGARLLDEDIPF